MRYLLAVFVCLSLAAHAQLDRIGGYMGKTSPSIKDDVRRTSSNPFKARVSRDVFIRDILPEVKGSYGITEDGRVIQTARYALDAYGQWRLAPITTGMHEIRIKQRFKDGLYLAYGSKYLHNGNAIAVELPGPAVADGSTIHRKLNPSGRIHRYLTVTGAESNIPIYVADPIPTAATEDDLTRAFDAGQAFEIIRPADFPCVKCKGSKREKYKHGTFMLTRPCSACNGTGKTKADALWSVSQ